MRCSIHIDAGYLYSALATRETGSANRAAINVDEAALVRALVAIATDDAGMRLLRDAVVRRRERSQVDPVDRC